jgi:hypothetical protein
MFRDVQQKISYLSNLVPDAPVFLRPPSRGGRDRSPKRTGEERWELVAMAANSVACLKRQIARPVALSAEAIEAEG